MNRRFSVPELSSFSTMVGAGIYESVLWCLVKDCPVVGDKKSSSSALAIRKCTADYVIDSHKQTGVLAAHMWVGIIPVALGCAY